MIKAAILHFAFSDYTIQLANHLAKFVNLTLIHSEKISNQYKDFLDPNIKIILIKTPRIRDPRNLITMAEIMQIVRKIKPDVFHVQETNNPWYDLTLLFNKNLPLITTIHDIFRHPGDRDLIPGAEYTRRVAFYRSQQLIVHSHELQKILIQQFNINEKKINVLPHGELGTLYQYWAKHQICKREPNTLLFFGRIWPYKGLKYLIEAIPIVAQKIPDIKLIIAGRGENVEELIKGQDRKYYQILNSFIPNDTVAGLFQKSVATILPYIESSQSGVAAIAYSLGTPVIASNIGGLGEMIKHQEDGLLVKPGDIQDLANTIIHLLTDHQLQEKIRRSALNRCQEDLSWSNIAQQTVEVYNKVISEKI